MRRASGNSKILSYIMGVCIFLSVPTTFLQAEDSANENLSPDMTRILDRGKVIVAMYQENDPPFCMYDNALCKTHKSLYLNNLYKLFSCNSLRL